jgi:hypothetical protein
MDVPDANYRSSHQCGQLPLVCITAVMAIKRECELNGHCLKVAPDKILCYLCLPEAQ